MAAGRNADATAVVIRERIERWMRETARRDLSGFPDLHIDQVHASFAPKARWIDGSLRCLETALLLRGTLRLPLVVAIGMSLESGPVPRGVSFDSLDGLAREIDHSPPSLYLFDDATSPWTSGSGQVDITHLVALPGNIPTRGWFHEWWDDDDDEFRRTVWIAG